MYFADSFGVAGDGSPGTTFSKRNPFAGPMREPERRIDYVFVRGPDDSQRGEPTEALVCFDQRSQGHVPERSLRRHRDDHRWPLKLL